MSNAKSKKYTNKKGANKASTKRFKNNDDRRDSTECALDMHSSKPNDWRWYVANEQILRDVASYSYGYPLGGKLNVDDPSTEGKRSELSLPGIMAIRLAPAVGYSDNYNSPVNIAARNLYTFIRHANAGAKNYNAPDLMLYLLAMDSAYSYLAFLKRIYGTVSVTNVMNRYYPHAAIEAMGVDYEEILGHVNDLRAYINMYALRIASLVIPAHMSYMAKHEWMYSGVYLDSASDKSQCYMFVPEGFHVFGLDEDGAGALFYTPLQESVDDKLTFEQLRDFGENLINPILSGIGDEDFNIISGDILKAYTESGIHRATIIPENFAVIPTYDATVIPQIQNCRMFGVLDSDSLNVVQSEDKGYLWSKPSKTYSGPKDLAPIVGQQLLTLDDVNPSPEMSLEATRLMVIPSIVEDPDNMNNTIIEYRGCASEIPTRAFIYFYGDDGLGGWQLQRSYEYHSNTTISFETAIGANLVLSDNDFGWSTAISITSLRALASALERMALMSNFRNHPVFYTGMQIVQESEGGGLEVASNFTPRAVYGNIANYTLISQSNLEAMAQAALLAEFGFENYGK